MSQPAPAVKKPSWLKTPIATGQTYFEIKEDLRSRRLHTVCEEAKCPNIGTCWNTRTATFMVLGDTCTRACRFCHIKTGNPAGLLDPQEPTQVAASCAQMKLDYVVLTMVDRDDLPDGGAAHVAAVIREVKARNPGIRTEILGGDFAGSEPALRTLVESGPTVLAHNLETVERLSPRVRDARASYRRTLEVLGTMRQLASGAIVTKSALMLGLGEEDAEVEAALADLREVGVEWVTLGQYMRPTRRHLSVKRWVPPDEFDRWADVARAMGFRAVASAPLVRSSYRARDYYEEHFPDAAP